MNHPIIIYMYRTSYFGLEQMKNISFVICGKNSQKGLNQLEMIQTYVETKILTSLWLQSRETTLSICETN